MTAPATNPRTTSSRRPDGRGEASQSLRRVAVVFAVALAAHGADHLRRGSDVITAQVRWAGVAQTLLAVITLVLVFRRHPWAPLSAIAIGFSSALGFTAVHLLPHWSSFSDPFTGSRIAPHVTALSWVAALLEIGADIALGWAGLRVVRAHGTLAPLDVLSRRIARPS
jgi:hypothetical protein